MPSSGHDSHQGMQRFWNLWNQKVALNCDASQIEQSIASTRTRRLFITVYAVVRTGPLFLSTSVPSSFFPSLFFVHHHLHEMIDRREDISFNTMAFPSKLYALLNDAESEGFTKVISWQAGGRSFNVHKQDQFSNAIMQTYFSQTKFKSFQRQLNIYGWKKVQLGPNKGGYEHKHFLQGHPELCDLIYRKKDTRLSTREQRVECFQQSLPFDVSIPNFIPLKNAYQENHHHYEPLTHNVALSETEVKSFYNFFFPQQQQSTGKAIGNALATMDESLFSLAPIPLNYDGTTPLNMSSSVTKVSVDFLQTDEVNELDGFISLLDDLMQDDADIHLDDETMQNVEEEKIKLDNDDTLESDHSFPFKLHLMLDSAERDCHSHIVSWVNGGTAFKVHDNKAFVNQVMPNYFDQSKYESFRRQLNLYQFKRVAKGDDRGVISHPKLVQGSRHLCKEITRTKNED